MSQEPKWHLALLPGAITESHKSYKDECWKEEGAEEGAPELGCVKVTLLVASCISYFPVTVNKILDRGSLRKAEFIVAHSARNISPL